MRTSKARVTGRSDAGVYGAVDGGAALSDLAARSARYVSVVLATLLLAAVTLVFTPGSPARADTAFGYDQVFSSVGYSSVDINDGSSGAQLANSPLVDSTLPYDPVQQQVQYNAGSAFDSKNNFYVTDDSQGAISEFSSTGASLGTFATGLSNPTSLVFDKYGNLYVGQQGAPYIAEFSPTGQRMPDIGPLQSQLTGDDWIDLSSDQCTFYYTSEGNDIYSYNKCTGNGSSTGTQGAYHTQGSTNSLDFNQVPFTGIGAFQLRILGSLSGQYAGDILVADATAVLLLDPNGNVIQTYPCASLPAPPGGGPACQGFLFAVSVDPNGTSFWTGDSVSGNVWQIDMATGNVINSFATGSPGLLFGLTVDGQLMAATSPTITPQVATNLTVPTASGSFSYGTPTPVSSVLTDASGNPIANEPVTFQLNGNSSETCTGTTDSTGTATCDITPTQVASTYTLTASFSNPNSTLAQSGNQNTITIGTDTTTLVYTGPTTAVNGQPVTLTANLTTDVPAPGTPLNGQSVTFTLGSQTCNNGVTDANGNVSCTIPTVDQTVSNVTVTANYGGSNVQSSASLPTPVPVLVSEPTTLTVGAATGDYSDATTVSGTLTDTLTGAPITGEHLTLTLDSNESCTTPPTDATGTASCSVTPSEVAATYPLIGSFFGDNNASLRLLPSTGSSNFVVTLEETTLTYTGPTVAQNGQTLTLSGVLTSEGAHENDNDAASAAPIAGRTVVFQLGSGASAQTCTGTTDATGATSCPIASVNQAPGPIPVTDTFAGDSYYKTASAASTVNLPEGTQLTINSTDTSGAYNGPAPVSATLTNTYTGGTPANEPVTLTINGNGTQSCATVTNAQGVATCDITPNEPAGSYTLTASFPGDTSSTPQLLPTDSSTTFTVTPAPTSVTYTGPTTVTNGQPVTLSGVVTSTEPTSGTPVGGETVTFTLGSQSCTGTSAANGDVSCTIAKVNQTSGTVTVATTVSGNSYYQPSSANPPTPVNVQSPTALTITFTTGQYGGATTVTGTLINTATGLPVVGQTVTLTLNGTQSCSAVTGANGQASCSIIPNEPAGPYTVSGSFGHNAPMVTSGPSLLPSTGSNTFVVTPAPTTIVNTSPTVEVNGMPITLSATLTTTGSGSGPGGLPVTLTLGSGSTAQSCTGIASPTGLVTCTITNPNQVSGTSIVTVTFGGNSYYQSSSNSTSETTASLPSTGDFVVGNLTADGNSATGKAVIGTTVDFWGSQYWKNNSFSGVMNPPASMKGYIDSAPQLNSCPVPNWTSDPGNSSHPPATVPVNMVIIVGSTITQSGSTELGDVKHLVIVKTQQAGYGPAPGHDGWGQITTNIC